MSAGIPRITLAEILRDYDVLYLDAYGVLLDHGGALPGAAELIETLHRTGKRYLVLTNDASRTPATSSRRYTGMGLPIPPERIITSGVLLARHLETLGPGRPRAAVLGPEDSREVVTRAGGVLVEVGDDADMLVICDEMGFPFREYLDRALTFLYRTLDRGDPVRLILANPDLVYPASPGAFGFTAGAMALLLEAALDLRYPGRGHRFIRLGKPHPPMFEEARGRVGAGRTIMIGDQLGTDIRGARDFGLDSALVTTGVARAQDLAEAGDVRPTYLLASLALPGPGDPGSS